MVEDVVLDIKSRELKTNGCLEAQQIDFMDFTMVILKSLRLQHLLNLTEGLLVRILMGSLVNSGTKTAL